MPGVGWDENVVMMTCFFYLLFYLVSFFSAFSDPIFVHCFKLLQPVHLSPTILKSDPRYNDQFG